MVSVVFGATVNCGARRNVRTYGMPGESIENYRSWEASNSVFAIHRFERGWVRRAPPCARPRLFSSPIIQCPFPCFSRSRQVTDPRIRRSLRSANRRLIRPLAGCQCNILYTGRAAHRRLLYEESKLPV